MTRATVGLILGHGMESLLAPLGGVTVEVETPYGRPSAPILVTELGSLRLLILARHGQGGRIPAHKVPARANIWALKKLGATQVLATGTVRCLRPEIPVGEWLLVDQVIDRTTREEATFFEDVAVHVELGSPFCERMREELAAGALAVRQRVGSSGRYACVNGPRHGTAAESNVLRALGADVVGMSAMPEAALAREAELCYALLAAPVAMDMRQGQVSMELAERLRANARVTMELRQRLLELLPAALPRLGNGAEHGCSCQFALATAIACDLRTLDGSERQKHSLLLSRYLPQEVRRAATAVTAALPAATGPVVLELAATASATAPATATVTPPKEKKRKARGGTNVLRSSTSGSSPHANHLTSTTTADIAFGEAFGEGF